MIDFQCFIRDIARETEKKARKKENYCERNGKKSEEERELLREKQKELRGRKKASLKIK